MALTAVLGGLTAFRTTQSEFVTGSCERLLSGAQTFELVRRQSYLELAAEHTKWFDQYHAHTALAQRLHDRARKLRLGNDPKAREVPAEYLDVAAQLENSVARAVKPLSDFVVPLDSRFAFQRDIDTALPAKIDEDLRELGLRNRCVTGEPGDVASDLGTRESSQSDASSYLQPLNADLATLRKRALRQGIALVGFIAVVGLCSLSEVARSWLRRVFQILAAATFATTVLFAIFRADSSLAVSYAVITLAFIAVTAPLWSYVIETGFLEGENQEGDVPETALLESEGHTLEPPEVEQAVGTPVIAIPGDGDRTGDRRRLLAEQGLVLAVALTALIFAIAGVLANKALRESDFAASRASEHQVALFRVVTKDEIVAYADIASLAALHEGRIRSAVAQQWLARSPDAASPAAWALWHEELERTHTTSASRFAQSRLYPEAADDKTRLTEVLQGERGPYRDATFPQRYFAAETVYKPAKLLALWDAYDEERDAWDRKAVVFLATLAVSTIGLNLLGQARGMIDAHGVRAALVLGSTGLVALVYAIVSVTSGYFSPLVAIHEKVPVPAACSASAQKTEPQRAQGAAECYAYAELLASSIHDEASRIAALSVYDEAANLRSGFALSQYREARTAAAIAAAQKHNMYSSLVFRKDVEQIVAAERRVTARLRDRGLVAPDGFLGQFAFHRFLFSLDVDDESSANRTIAQLAQLLVRNPNETTFRYHLGLMRLAVGSAEDAARDYSAATRQTASIKNDDERVAVATSAITDLELMRHNCRTSWAPSRYCESVVPRFLDETEASIVRAAWQKARDGTNLDLTLGAPSFTLTPSGIGWRVPRIDDRNGASALVLLAFRYDPAWDSWNVIPSSSYQIPSKLGRFRKSITNFRSYLTKSGYNDCLDMQGGYRVDFYSNGRRVSRGELSPRLAIPFNGVAFRDTGVGMCYPAPPERAWQRWNPVDGSLAAGFHAPGLTDGAYVYAYLSGRQKRSRTLVLNDPVAIARAVNDVLRRLGRTELSRRGFHAKWLGCGTFFDSGTPHVEYTSPTLTLLAKAWTKPDGLVNVGVVWYGARSALPAGQVHELSCLTLTSMTSLDDAIPASSEIPGSTAALGAQGH
jgi:hypothetical protein